MNIFGLGTPELLLIALVLLLFFGKDRLPGLARSLGRSIQELKNGFNSKEEQKDNVQQESEKGKEEKSSGTQ